MKKIKKTITFIVPIIIFGCTNNNNPVVNPSTTPIPSPTTISGTNNTDDKEEESPFPKTKGDNILESITENVPERIVGNPYSTDININENGDGLLVYGGISRKIEKYKISEESIKFYTAESSDQLSISHKIILNKNGDGFILFNHLRHTICFDIVRYMLRYNQCNYSYKSYSLVKNFVVEKSFKDGDFDNISIDDNGNGIAYTSIDPEEKGYNIDSERTNKISFRRINNLVISDKKEEIEKFEHLPLDYIFPKVSINPKGDGLMEYAEIKDNFFNLYSKKINNFIPEKDFKLIKSFQLNDSSIGRDYLKVDNNGDGYLTLIFDGKRFIKRVQKYQFDDNEIQIENSKSEDYLNTSEFFNNPDYFDDKGNGVRVYIAFDDPNKRDNLFINKIKNFKVTEEPTLVKVTGKSDSISTYFNKNGDGFIIWKEYSSWLEEVHIQYLKNYQLQ